MDKKCGCQIVLLIYQISVLRSTYRRRHCMCQALLGKSRRFFVFFFIVVALETRQIALTYLRKSDKDKGRKVVRFTPTYIKLLCISRSNNCVY